MVSLLSMQNFWEQLERPILALAPMEDVTDAAFRRLIAETAKPPVMFTEFTSADGLIFADADAQKRLRKKLEFSDIERPIVAQLFTSDVERMERGAHIAAELGFDGFDINMGCPVDEVVRQGCGAALIKNAPLARELIRAAKKAGLPVSVKTRIGFNTDELDSWLPELLGEEPAAITIHARTRKEMSAVPARWDAVARAVTLRDSLGSKTLILGNGDLQDIPDARAKVAASGADGAMLGRAIYGNPWLFAERTEPATPRERLEALMRHLALFDELLGGFTNYATMKKHFKAYVSGWDGAKELRVRLMETENVPSAQAIISSAILSA
jgi:tRNA-dihydrouridine synthase